MVKFALLCSAGAAAVLVPAQAQEQGREQAVDRNSVLPEIIVSAQRRDESLMDVPISISAFGDRAIREQQINGIDDVLDRIPNVTFVSQGSRDRKEISLRGVSNQLDPYRAGRQQAYAFYIDEFNVAIGTSNPEILDLERIEVLRGPQGTYFGRNAVGGAINITTRKPNNDWFAEIGGSYASFDTRSVHGIVNVPIIEDVLAIRASGELRETDGWIENINPIGGGNDGEFANARITARATPTDRLTWDFTYSYMRGEEGMRVGVPTGFNTATWAFVYYRDEPGFIADPDGVGFYPENDDKVNFNRPQAVGTEFDYYSTRITYDFDNMTLTAVGGTLSNFLFNKGDIDGGSIDAFYEDRLINRDSISGELRLQSNNPQTLEWSVGAIVGEDKGDLEALTFHGNESPLGGAPDQEVTAAISDIKNSYWALFGQLTWNITDALNATVGARYSREKVSFDGIRRSNGIVNDSTDRSATFDDISPRFTVSYQTPEAGLVYATVSKGFKAGGVQNSGLAQLRNEFDPETLWNYELGWKSEFFDRRLRVNLAGFYMDWKDVQQFIRFQFLDDEGFLRSATAIDNAASASSKGVELAIESLPTDSLSFGGTVGFLDSQYEDYPDALIDGQLIDASGKPLVNAPRWTITTHAEYRRDIADGAEVFLRGEWFYRGEQLTSTFGLLYEFDPFIAPAYNVVNLRAGIGTDRWDLNFFVENLFDEEYFASSYEQAFYSGVQVEPAVRMIGANLRFRFGALSD